MLNNISNKDILDFNRVFSMLLTSRLSIVDALELIVKQTKNEKLRGLIKQVLSDVKSGSSLSSSFRKYPKVFPEIYLANLRIAEETGNIAEVLNEYTEYQEKFLELKRKIIQAGRYPLFVIFVSLGVIFFMLYFLIPTFETLFKSVKAALPPITALLLKLSNFMIENGLILSISIAAISMIIYYSLRTKTIKEKIVDKLLIRAPYLSRLYKQNLLARFALSMGILLKSRVTLLEALRISKNITDNSIFREEISSIIRSLIKGNTISGNLGNSKFFDLTFSRLLAAGEESAELDKVFYMISDFYSKEFDHKIEALTSLIEPVLILFVGGIVAIILIAMYLPMFEIINYIGV